MSEATCWTMIHGAASGDAAARREFAQRYLPVVRSYLRARWSRIGDHDLEDALQEVFVECLRTDGALERARPGSGEGFRAFLFGVARNVALRQESRRAARRDGPLSESFHADQLPGHEESSSRVFDRAWAEAMLREAMEHMRDGSRSPDAEANRRVELLELRFREGVSIHDIAERWKQDRSFLHHEYRRALRDFERSLREVVAFHHPGAPEAIGCECSDLLALVR